MITRVLSVILITCCVSFFVRPADAQTEMYCFDNFAQATAKAAEFDEKFMWSTFNLLGAEMFFFSGPRTWTVFIKSQEGEYCTSPALIGVIKPMGRET